MTSLMATRYLWRTRPLIAVAAVGLTGPALMLIGSEDAVPLRLRFVGVVLASLLALTWEDRTAPLVASTPIGLPSVQRARLLLLLAAVAVAWGASCFAASQRVPDVGAWWATLEMAALGAVVSAIMGGLARGRPGENLAAYPMPLAICLLLLATRLPVRFNLIASPDSPAWVDVHQRWAVLLLLGLLALAYVARDPASRPVFRRPSTSGASIASTGGVGDGGIEHS